MENVLDEVQDVASGLVLDFLNVLDEVQVPTNVVDEVQDLANALN